MKNAVDGLAYQMNTTNMAQVFKLVEEMIFLRNYKRAMSAVLTRTNGQPSFKFQTSEQVLWLRDEQAKMFLPPVTGLLVEQLGITKMEGKQPPRGNLIGIASGEASSVGDKKPRAEINDTR